MSMYLVSLSSSCLQSSSQKMMDQRCGLVLHVRTDVIPLLRHLIFRQKNSLCFVGHNGLLSSWRQDVGLTESMVFMLFTFRRNKKVPCIKHRTEYTAVPPVLTAGFYEVGSPLWFTFQQTCSAGNGGVPVGPFPARPSSDPFSGASNPQSHHLRLSRFSAFSGYYFRVIRFNFNKYKPCRQHLSICFGRVRCFPWLFRALLSRGRTSGRTQGPLSGTPDAQERT